ncbi:MAG: type I-G CRISPR-associated RAMP protein Csb1/Cas7g, partial [Verrucomicrobiales bacterium]
MKPKTPDILQKFDHYLAIDGPPALVIREQLIPVEGNDAVFFPPTYAASEDKTFKGGYNINEFTDGSNIVLVDSVGSQANRIEPLFKTGDYVKLVPQITIKAGEKEINLLDAGHRAGDAIVRCSSLQSDLQKAFKDLLQGDALPLANIAPTSLVFGVWDSRDTQAKAPRLISSTIRAFDVKELTRSAQYWAGASPDPLTVYDNESVLGPIKDAKDRKERSTSGFTHVPATGTHGGVIAGAKGIRRDATLALAALRLLSSNSDEDSLCLRRYILGLALVAFTKLPGGYLRQGTILVNDGERTFKEVAADGTRTDCTLTHKEALEYATAAAAAFGVSDSRVIDFDGKAA